MAGVTHLTWALRQLGQHEQGGANMGAVVERSIALWSDAPAGPWALWCAGFASTALVAGGCEGALDIGTLGAERLHERMRPFWVVDEPPAPGDVVWFRRGLGGWHVGLVAEVLGGYPLLQVRTVEGNAGDAVSSRTYAWREARIIGHARPRLLGPCGALPAASGPPTAPCELPAGHPGACALGRPADVDSAPRLLPPQHPRQGRALRVLREQVRLQRGDAARRVGLGEPDWASLEAGVLGLAPETFASVCRGIASAVV